MTSPAPLSVVASPASAADPVMAPDVEWQVRAEAAREAFPKGRFGEGWLTNGARDSIRIAAFAGFDAREVITRVALTSNPSRMTNAATVDRVMFEMETEWRAAHAQCCPSPQPA